MEKPRLFWPPEEPSGLFWPADPSAPSDHRKLTDLLPTPVFVRSALGEILYANRAGSLAVGEVPGILPASWQVTPQVAAMTHPLRMAARAAAMSGAAACPGALAAAGEGELDLPQQPLSIASPEELPSATAAHYVLLQGRGAAMRSVLTMHRIPFWLAVPGADGFAPTEKRAVVMYVAPVTGGQPQLFFPTGWPTHQSE